MGPGRSLRISRLHALHLFSPLSFRISIIFSLKKVVFLPRPLALLFLHPRYSLFAVPALALVLPARAHESPPRSTALLSGRFVCLLYPCDGAAVRPPFTPLPSANLTSPLPFIMVNSNHPPSQDMAVHPRPNRQHCLSYYIAHQVHTQNWTQDLWDWPGVEPRAKQTPPPQSRHSGRSYHLES